MMRGSSGISPSLAERSVLVSGLDPAHLQSWFMLTHFQQSITSSVSACRFSIRVAHMDSQHRRQAAVGTASWHLPATSLLQTPRKGS